MPALLWTLPEAVRLLREHYGQPEWPPTADPFELILLESVAYLASPARRREAFEMLRREVGTSPAEILAASPQALEKITARGILKATFAARLVECARLAQDQSRGDLLAATAGPLETAGKALRSFPGIGKPGADKILLFMGRHARLAPESNGLRILVRLGLVQEEKSYAKTYAGSLSAEKALPEDVRARQEAHLLLHQHGLTLCKRTAPRCGECPLEPKCAFPRREPLKARGRAGPAGP